MRLAGESLPVARVTRLTLTPRLTVPRLIKAPNPLIYTRYDLRRQYTVKPSLAREH